MKPTYVLIDTCSWVDQLALNWRNNLLFHLDYWIEKKEIILLLPETVLEEWNEKKEMKKREIINELNTKHKNFKEVARSSKLPSIPEPTLEIDELENQIELIDTILKKSIRLEISESVKVFLSDRIIAGEAPFHSDKARKHSMKDAYIIFSTLEYLKNEKKKKLIFISANKNDFGHPKFKDEKIHPDILKDSKEVSIDYYAQFGRAWNDLKKLLGEPPIKNSIDKKKKNGLDLFPLDDSKEILDQLFDYFSEIFKEVNMLPNHLLFRSQLFRTNINSAPQAIAFKVIIEKEDVFNYLKGIEVSSQNEILIKDEKIHLVDDYENKVSIILKKFSSNLIYYFQKRRSTNILNLAYLDKTECNCVRCSLSKFKLSHSFKLLKNRLKSENQQEELKLAYVHYKLGNYLSAAKILIQIRFDLQDSPYKITSFIVEYNLKRLYGVLRYYSIKNEEDKELVESLKLIDLEKEFLKFKDKKNEKLLIWIKEDSFCGKANDDCITQLLKVKEHYSSQLNGNWGENNHIWQLINNYGKAEGFINYNFIIYDRFGKFLRLTELFIEGIFASYAVNQPKNSKLNSIDDWSIMRMIRYGNSSFIYKQFNKYRLQKLSYSSKSNSENFFFQFTDNFLNDIDIEKNFAKYCEKENTTFWFEYNKYFENFLIFVALTDLKKQQVNQIIKSLLILLKHNQKIRPQFIKNLERLISRKGKLISKLNFRNLLYSTIDDSRLQNESFVLSLTEQIFYNVGNIALSKQKYKKLKEVFFEQCIRCNENHPSEISVNLALIVAEESQKRELKSIVIKSLEQKFVPDLFYSAVLFGLIKVRKKWLILMLEKSLPKNNSPSTDNIFTRKPFNIYSRLSDFINLAFKENIDLTDERFDMLRGTNDYYNWLLDMEGFDYSKFDLTWIAEYRTKFYLNKIASIPKIKRILINHLKNKNDGYLERFYVSFLVNHFDL